MGFKDEIEGASRRLHDYIGRDVSVVTREKTGTDDRNNPIFEETSVLAKAEIVPSGTANISNEMYGMDTDIDVVVYLPDDIDVYDGSGSNDATRIVDEYGTSEYRVNGVHHQRTTGKMELYCSVV